MIEISFRTETLSSEQKHTLTDFIHSKLSELSKVLDLSTLERIIISQNFTEDVLQMQKQYRMRETGHTERPDGIAVAKVLDTGIEEHLKQTIVVNDYLMAWLFLEEYRQYSFHMLHHELCHVHDNYYKHKMFSLEARAGKGLNKHEHVLVYNADPVWGEYVAVRLSSSSFAISDTIELPTNNLYMTYLIDLIISSKTIAVDAIASYRYEGDISKLYNKVQEETSMLFKIAATTQGVTATL